MHFVVSLPAVLQLQVCGDEVLAVLFGFFGGC